eukprot:2799516-Rhodomonas_salina.1
MVLMQSEVTERYGIPGPELDGILSGGESDESRKALWGLLNKKRLEVCETELQEMVKEVVLNAKVAPLRRMPKSLFNVSKDAEHPLRSVWNWNGGVEISVLRCGLWRSGARGRVEVHGEPDEGRRGPHQEASRGPDPLGRRRTGAPPRLCAFKLVEPMLNPRSSFSIAFEMRVLQAEIDCEARWGAGHAREGAHHGLAGRDGVDGEDDGRSQGHRGAHVRPRRRDHQGAPGRRDRAVRDAVRRVPQLLFRARVSPSLTVARV